MFQNRELGLDFICCRFREGFFFFSWQIALDRGREVFGGALIAGRCPVGCDASSAIVAGSYVFTPESGVCKAAVHAKVLAREMESFLSLYLKHSRSPNQS